jgi:hypothetical protein
LPAPGPYWSAIGTGDFDGNGKDDVLIRGAGASLGYAPRRAEGTPPA